MDISKIRRNVKAITEGEWVSNIPGAGELRLKVRGMTAPEVREFRSKLERSASAEDRHPDGTLRGDKSMEILAETLFEKVLLDWDGLTDDGNPVKYSPALAKEWLTNPEYEEFGDAVVWAAHSVDRLRIKKTEEIAGN